MKNRLGRIAFTACLVFLTSTVAQADELIEEYSAYIGQDDLYNSNNQRLTQPWQIIRQDRANVHRFGARQPGDEVDGFFHSAGNRELLERMLRRGRIEGPAAERILGGDVRIRVQIWQKAGGDYVLVTVDEGGASPRGGPSPSP